MPTSISSVHMANTYTKVKVNVRLCGSIPRVDLSSLMQQQEQQQLQESPNLPQNADSKKSNSLPEIPSSYLFKTKEEDCVAQKLRSHLITMQQEQAQQTKKPVRQPQHNFYSQGISPSRRQSPTYEAPSWAVPASGEARLEVRMSQDVLFLFSMLMVTYFTFRIRVLTRVLIYFVSIVIMIVRIFQSIACLRFCRPTRAC